MIYSAIINNDLGNIQTQVNQFSLKICNIVIVIVSVGNAIITLPSSIIVIYNLIYNFTSLISYIFSYQTTNVETLQQT